MIGRWHERFCETNNSKLRISTPGLKRKRNIYNNIYICTFKNVHNFHSKTERLNSVEEVLNSRYTACDFLIFFSMIDSLAQQLQQAIDHLRQEFSGLHTGRANVGMVDEVKVEVYGSHMALKGTANISCPDAQTIRIEPWDKSIVGVIEKAIRDGDLGLNPQNMGEHLLVPVPPMTDERRQQMVKKVHQSAENTRIAIRNIRQDALKKVKNKKDGKEISEDEAARFEKQIQEKVDESNKTVDEVTKNKEADITSL